MKTIVIDRKTWYRGHGAEESKLLRHDGKQCCVGFAAEQCGVPSEYLLNTGTLWRVKEDHKDTQIPDVLAWLAKEMYCFVTSDGDNTSVYLTNDSTNLTEEQREATLTELFAKHDIKLEFIN